MGSSYPQQGVGGDVNLPNTIAQVLIDHNVANHNILGLERNDLTGLQEPVGRFWVNGDIQIPDSAITKILYDATSFENGTSFNADGIDSDFICAIAGVYYFYALATLEALANNCILDIYVYFNGGVAANRTLKKGEASDYGIDIAHLGRMGIGDIVDIRVKHTHGVNRVLEGDEDKNYVLVYRLGD